MTKPIILSLLGAMVCILAPSAEAQTPAEVAAAFSKAGIPVLRKQTPITDFTLPLLDGKTVTLSSLKGKVVFLNFWATWCPPCRQEMPSMEALYQRFKELGLEFLAVDIQEDNLQVRSFMKDFNLTFPVAMDTSGGVSNKYGIRGIPATYIIDREGNLILSSIGGRDWSSPAVVSAFEVLLRYGR